MPKEQYRETDVAKRLCKITFGVESAECIQQMSDIQVVANILYNNNEPQPYGVLDKRLGAFSKEFPCETCGKNLNECVGHFGYIDLEAPVFHVGYFKNIINILQCICKSCSRVLLTVQERAPYMAQLSRPDISYLVKKNMCKQVIEKCKKKNKCPYCKEPNGIVKKLPNSNTTFMKIVHEKQKLAVREELLRNQIEEFQSAVENMPQLENAVASSVVPEILSPIDVLTLFEKIPQTDIVLLAMDSVNTHPKDLLLTRMLVPPTTIRPSIQADLKNGSTEDDLTVKLHAIVFATGRQTEYKNSGAVSNFENCWERIQLLSGLYINGELSGIPSTIKLPKNRTRGLVQRLKGKQGRFRGNLSGKRVDFSSRTVISPDPNLQIDQVGVPEFIAKILTYPERITNANIMMLRQLVMNGPDRWPGANYVQQKGSPFRKFLKYGNRDKLAQELRVGDVVERHLKDDDIVLFNRQPSLHKLSIMAHRAKIHGNKTLRFNECVCNPYNADFDGDEMNLHLPQTEESKAEALILMSNKDNLVTPRNGEILIAPTQDFLTGAYILTSKNRFFDRDDAMQLAAQFLTGEDTVDFPRPCILKPKQLWSGKQIISLAFRPNKESPIMANLEAKGRAYTNNREFCRNESYVVIRNSVLLAGAMDKNHLGSGGKGSNIFYVILRDFNADAAIRSMWRLSRITTYFLTAYYAFSIGIEDVMPSKKLIKRKDELLAEGYKKCDEYIKQMAAGSLQCQPGCTAEETLENLILKELSVIRDRAGQACIAELPPDNSPLVMALSGSKGSIINISQMIACVGQQALNGKRVPDGFQYRSLPHFPQHCKSPAAKGFVENSFYSGLNPTEFFYHAMAGREGLTDTAVKTADTGYMQRRLVKCLEDLAVHYDNSVRNAEHRMLEVEYGGDGLDPVYMEGKDQPIEFARLLEHIKATHPDRSNSPMTSEQIEKTASYCAQEELGDCSDVFQNNVRQFIEQVVEKVKTARAVYNKNAACKEVERLTVYQLVMFYARCREKYNKARIAPGTPVGSLAAQSIGEPGTQMTLKTFHFAGVASMNITQGVPRIKEIINANVHISTPIIRATLEDSKELSFARMVKGRIERTTLEQVTSHIDAVFRGTDCYLLIKIDMARIKLLKLEVTLDSIKNSICASKLKLKQDQVIVATNDYLIVYPGELKNATCKSYALSKLRDRIPHVVIKGISTVNRAVIARDDSKGDTTYSLCIEGCDLREVMATRGVVGEKTISNNIMEVYKTLGIEAARQTIINEIKMVMENHGMSIDQRHIMLLASQMTHTGEVLGITRQGLAKSRQSVLNLASFERTADHLFDAAYYGHTDEISGVSENIIVGMPAPIGTGMVNLLQKQDKITLPKPEPLLFEEGMHD